MTPEQERKMIAAMAAAPGPVRLLVNPSLVPPGKMYAMVDGGGAAMVFHSEAERDVWLDEAREQGLKG